MLIQEVTDALGISIIGADLTKQIATYLDSEDGIVRNRSQKLSGWDIQAAPCELALRHVSGRRTPEAISGRS